MQDELPDSAFCGAYDARIAKNGPAAIFVRTPEGEWRVDGDLSRVAWQRLGAERLDLGSGDLWNALVRDKATGFVSWWLVNHPAMLEDHPRLDATLYKSAAEATAALEKLGTPPLARMISSSDLFQEMDDCVPLSAEVDRDIPIDGEE